MFKNRKDAGEQLAEALIRFRDEEPLILAIPRGGVEVGYYIAKKLNCELSVVISRKLGHPRQPEAAFGAMAEDKSLYLNPKAYDILTKDMIESVMEKEEREIQRRIRLYRNGKPLPPIRGRTVILVDDGIATGSTLLAAVELCKKQNAGKIIVASPVSSSEMLDKLNRRVDEAVILTIPKVYYAVSQAYEEFQNITDERVVAFLEKAGGLRTGTQGILEENSS